MNHVVGVEEESGQRSVRSNAVNVRTLARACARARNVKLNKRAVPIANKAVIHICVVSVPSRDRSARIDSKRKRTLEGTWDVTSVRRIERGEGASPIRQETVTQIVRVKIISHDGSTRTKAPAERTLARARARGRNIVCGDHAPLIPEEAVVRIRPVSVKSCNRPAQANCEWKRTLAGSCARTRRVERGEAAIPIPEETVTHKGGVSGPSRDRSVRVHNQRAERKGALKWPCACPWRIEDGNHTLIGANIAVEHIDCVIEESCNGSTRIDGVGPRTLAGSRARTRRVEDGETAVLGPDETVPYIVRVTAESYDCPKWIDVGGIGPLKGARARTRCVKRGNGLRKQGGGYCQSDQDDCRRHKLKFSSLRIELFHTR